MSNLTLSGTDSDNLCCLDVPFKNTSYEGFFKKQKRAYKIWFDEKSIFS